jgi:hypothetical protein
VTSPDVVPPDGVTESHDPPSVSAVYCTGVVVLLTPTFWLSDVAAELDNESVRAFAVRKFALTGATINVTPTVCGLFPAPVDVTVTDPL